MTSSTPPIGDVIMLSQLAWRMECAFRSARAGAPKDFEKVEIELRRLTKSITAFAQTLDEHDCPFQDTDQSTMEIMGSILGFCRQILDDLDSFVCQYQEFKRPEGVGWFAGQRSWKSIFVRNYKNIWWTSEGGDLNALIELLALHSQGIRLIKQALRSNSLWHFEEIVEAVAVDLVQVANHTVQGDIDAKIVELQHMMFTMDSTEESPPPVPPRAMPNKPPSRPLTRPPPLEADIPPVKQIILPQVEPPMSSIINRPRPKRKQVPSLSWSENSSPISSRESAVSANLESPRRRSSFVPIKQWNHAHKAMTERGASHRVIHRATNSDPSQPPKKIYKAPRASHSFTDLRSAPPAVPLPPVPQSRSVVNLKSAILEPHNLPPNPPTKDLRVLTPLKVDTQVQPSVFEGSPESPSFQTRRNQTSKWWKPKSFTW